MQNYYGHRMLGKTCRETWEAYYDNFKYPWHCLLIEPENLPEENRIVLLRYRRRYYVGHYKSGVFYVQDHYEVFDFEEIAEWKYVNDVKEPHSNNWNKFHKYPMRRKTKYHIDYIGDKSWKGN